MKRRLAFVAAAVVLALVGAAVAGGANKLIAHATRLKGTNVWYAQGKAVMPRTISARVLATPAQRVKVQWAVVCQKPNKADPAIQLAPQGTSGQTSIKAGATVKLALPYPRPPTCLATVYATLAKNGRLVLELRQT